VPTDVHVYVFDTLADWEAAFAIAGINNPDMQKDPGRYRIRTFSPDGQMVTSAGGLRIQPDAALSQVRPEESAMLILPGGDSWDEGKNTEAVDLAKQFLAAEVPVAAICGATLGLAKGGVFTSRQHTSNAPEYLAATGYRGKSHYRKKPVVTDGPLITASSTASLEFARAIFEKLDLYPAEVLAAWYGLFSTGKQEYFQQLVAAGSRGGAAG
jgi:putative intracellular protease/amidase